MDRCRSGGADERGSFRARVSHSWVDKETQQKGPVQERLVLHWLVHPLDTGILGHGVKVRGKAECTVPRSRHGCYAPVALAHHGVESSIQTVAGGKKGRDMCNKPVAPDQSRA